MSMFPPIGLLNRYYLGDSVLLEPIAAGLSQVLGSSIMIVSRHKELFKFHPNIIGIDPDDVSDSQLRIVDLSDAIGHNEEIRDIDLNNETGTKLAEMYMASGMDVSEMKGAKLYLSSVEQKNAEMYRSLFTAPLIGIVPTSRFLIKDWPYMRLLIKQLVRKHYSVFIFSDDLNYKAHCILHGLSIYRVVGKNLREMMTWLSIMDVVIGPDTGPLHVAGALGVPTVVVAYQKFYDLYEHTSKCIVLTGKRKGLFNVSARKMTQAITEVVNLQKAESSHEILFCRWRGIGDVLLTLPAIATLKAQDPHSKYIYMTSPVCAKILKASKIIDKVITIDYDHATSGKPRLPDDIDFDKYSCVYNLVNRVDFEPESNSIERTEMFGELLDVETIDYSTDWKLNIPYSWKRNIRLKLMKLGLGTKKPYIALQIGSAGWSRVWQQERWHEFVRLAFLEGYPTVLLSDVKIDDVPEGGYNLTGVCSIEEYVGAIAASKVFVGPDSSGVHIAGSIGHPAIGLFGSVSPKLRISHYDSVFAIVGKAKCVPCNDSQLHSCHGEEHFPHCMWSIQAEEVLRAVKSSIKKGGKNATSSKR